MDISVNEKNYELLEADKYTFFVLRRIMAAGQRKQVTRRKTAF